MKSKYLHSCKVVLTQIVGYRSYMLGCGWYLYLFSVYQLEIWPAHTVGQVE